MRKAFFLFIPFLFFLFIFSTSVFARSGCCSYHNGVRADGCGCNDGTPLSSTCAPYYPKCNGGENTNTPIPLPTWTSVPTNTPIPSSTPIPVATLTPIPTKIISVTKKTTVKKINKSKKQTVKKKTFWQWLFGK